MGRSSKYAERQIVEQQAQRAQAVQGGLADINRAFAEFNPAFYGQARQATIANLLPQLNQQFAQGQRDLITELARRGLVRSSSASRLGANLQQQYAVGKTEVGNRALDAEASLRQHVAQQKQSLVNALQSSQDPSLAGQQAVELAATIRSPSSIAPLGNLFSGVLQPMVASQMARAYNPYVPTYGSHFGLSSMNPAYFVGGK